MKNNYLIFLNKIIYIKILKIKLNKMNQKMIKIKKLIVNN
jgi:hypothetical protein